jgi:hypothetical protein
LNILAGTLRDNGGDTPEPETAPATATANPK